MRCFFLACLLLLLLLLLSRSGSTHLAVTLENGTFLNNQLLGLDISVESGGTFEDKLFLAFDISLNCSSNDGRNRLDFTFNATWSFNNQFAFNVDTAIYDASYADIALADDIALDLDAVSDLCDFLFTFVVCHITLLEVEEFLRILRFVILCNCIMQMRAVGIAASRSNCSYDVTLADISSLFGFDVLQVRIT